MTARSAVLKDLLKAVVEEKRTLTRTSARGALRAILAGKVEDTEIAALLTALATRGETVDELAGFVEELRAQALPIPLTEGERARLVDTCGTGGDGLGTFNISTGAALVAAAAGARVAKHGNRAVTSRCGSADVLEALGVPVGLGPEQAAECLRATGFVFLFAPLLQPAMRRVQPVRRALGFRTIFNLAGPLTNPAGASRQVMGVYAADKVPLVAQAMVELDMERAFVVHGSDGLDELTLTGESYAADVLRGIRFEEQRQVPSYLVRHERIVPEQAGLSRAPLAALRGGDTVVENVAILEAIFSGKDEAPGVGLLGPKRDIVLLNAAAALVAAGIAPDLAEGVARGLDAIRSGAVQRTLDSLRDFNAVVMRDAIRM